MKLVVLALSMALFIPALVSAEEFEKDVSPTIIGKQDPVVIKDMKAKLSKWVPWLFQEPEENLQMEYKDGSYAEVEETRRRYRKLAQKSEDHQQWMDALLAIAAHSDAFLNQVMAWARANIPGFSKTKTV